MNALTELELRSNEEARHAHRELVEELEAKLAKAVEALGILADCVDAGCFCSEMEMATAMDKARTTLAELKGETDD